MSDFTSGIRDHLQYLRPSPELMWTDLPFDQEPLVEIMMYGSGKDADIYIELRDGRQYALGLGWGLRVTGCPGLEVETIACDDASFSIRYYGVDLVVSRMRCEVPTWGGIDEDQFREELRQWLASVGEEQLHYALAVEIELAQSGSTTPGALVGTTAHRAETAATTC